MGAEPGSRFLTQPAAKLEPVIVVFDKERRIIIIIIIHAFIKRRNPTCRSKALNNDFAEVTCKAN